MATKTFDRPDVVHQLRESVKGMRTTKCGLTDKNQALAMSAWSQDITCDQCNP